MKLNENALSALRQKWGDAPCDHPSYREIRFHGIAMRIQACEQRDEELTDEEVKEIDRRRRRS